jgi:uncharacterized protein YbbC (DUF1343 family)
VHPRSLLPLLFLATAFLYAQPAPILPGAAVLLRDQTAHLAGRRIGLVTNHTARLPDGRHLADALRALPGVRLAALFAPEHGIRGDVDGAVADTVDPATGVPVYSLYGDTRHPTDAMLSGIDLLIFDIQDVGARFYTYTTTLGDVLEAAATRHLPVLVLDRPNPLGGTRMEGPLAEDSLRSFVAFARIPITHGMTIGELAAYFNGEGCLTGGAQADLTVIPMERWTRGMWFDQSGLDWIPPSPNMGSLASATSYPGTCLFEGTNVSEGRGTDTPFVFVGAPWADGGQLAERLASMPLPGVRFEPVSFTPTPRNRMPTHVKFSGVGCHGVRIAVIDRDLYEPVRTGVTLLSAFRTLWPDSFQWRPATFDRLAGTRALRAAIDRGETPEAIRKAWEEGLREFTLRRRKYLLYP